MYKIDHSDYLKKLKHCFMGKAIGGTLGMPLEGLINTKEMTYYDPVPEKMLENDDLDLQVVWLEVIKRRGLPINRRDLAEGWLEHLRGLPDEYGVCINNLETGIYPPLSGYFNNKFFSGMGSAIRTEIWAAIAPGDPKLAVRLAREDACVDHYSDGLDASSFLVALESMAYVENDREVLIETAKSYMNPNGRLYSALTDVKVWWEELHDVYAVREKILSKYYHQNWTDVSINLSYILLAWYAGEGDFSKSICIAAGLGHDADCTTATLGSILGILAEKEFEERWIKPLGNDLVLSSCISSMHAVTTIDEFCEQLAELCFEVQVFYDSKVRIDNNTKRIEDVYSWGIADAFKGLEGNYNLKESIVSVRPLIVMLEYPEPISLKNGETAEYKLEISHPRQKAFNGNIKLRVPHGWSVSPDKFYINVKAGEKGVITFDITAPKGVKRIPYNPLDIYITNGDMEFSVSAGLPQVMEYLSVPCSKAPVKCPELTDFSDSVIHSANMIFSNIPDEGRLFCAEFRPSQFHADAVLVAQGSGEMKVWLDGELILEHDGFEYVPAFHRSDYVATIKNLSDTWHRLYIWIGEKNAERKENNPCNSRVPVEGSMPIIDQRKKYDSGKLLNSNEREMFVGFADRSGWHWIWDSEWRIPNL